LNGGTIALGASLNQIAGNITTVGDVTLAASIFKAMFIPACSAVPAAPGRPRDRGGTCAPRER